MSRHGLSGRLRPTRQQELLLECALGTPEVALTAWRRVRAGLDFERLDAGSHALLPLVYRSLDAAKADDALLARLQGIYKKAWFVNHLLLDRAGLPLRAMHEAGAEPLLLHGSALLAAYYPDPALRRLPRFDVAVRPKFEDAARRALGRARWARHPESADPESKRPLAFVDTGGRLLFLHRRLPDGLDVPGTTDSAAGGVWENTRGHAMGGGVTVLRLDATDELLCACAAGPDTDIVTGVQWLADAAMVIEAAGAEIDWPRLVDSARRRRVTARVRGALEYLAAKLAVPIPASALAELRSERIKRRDRSGHWLYSRPVGRLGGLPNTLGVHLRETSDVGLATSLRRLPSFLSAAWELEGPREIPRAVSRKAWATARMHDAR